MAEEEDSSNCQRLLAQGGRSAVDDGYSEKT